jgi:hypothetical protein
MRPEVVRKVRQIVLGVHSAKITPIKRKHLSWLPTISVLVLVWVSFGGMRALLAQEMHHGGPSVPSSILAIRTYEGKTLSLTVSDLAALPHKSVTVFNAHSKVNESYSGVPISVLLSRVAVPQGEQVKGSLFMTGIVAEGTDGYRVLYSLAEVDPAIHTGDVIVAELLDGKKLDKDGAFKLVSTEEKRPARWVRNLTAIAVIAVTP